MHRLKVLVLELLPIDALASRAVSLREVSALDHEALDDAVEDGALVVKRLAGGADAFLAGAQGAEILGGLGHDVGVLNDRLVDGKGKRAALVSQKKSYAAFYPAKVSTLLHPASSATRED
jgi:hypothetical protein